MTFTQALQREQTLSFGLPLERVTAGFDAMLPTPARVARVACQEHRTCRRTRDEREMTRGMSRTEDRVERPVTKDIDDPVEFPVRVFREPKLTNCRPSIEEAIFHPLNEHVLELLLRSFTGARVKRNIFGNVRHARDVIEMDMGHEDAFERNSFRIDGRQRVLPDQIGR